MNDATRTARPRPGDVLDVPGVGPCTVLDRDDPSLIKLGTPRGSVLRVGERGLAQMLANGPRDDL